MALGGNRFLGNEYSIADGAVLALGLAGLGAGGLHSRVDHFRVARGGDLFHTGDDRAADGALRTGLVAGLGAGSGQLGNLNGSMARCADGFRLCFLADRAGIGHDTGVLTGRRGRDLALIPAVALGGNRLSSLDRLIADGADRIASIADLGAGRLTSITNLGQRVVIRPAGFEGQVGEGIEPCVTPLFIFDPIRLIETVAHGSGDEPTGEVIAFTGEGAFGKRVAPT